ncbi:hypothetical protein NLC29_00395 [Candidatus Aminicenantes bacterium AH-873-B07]|jgi:hypothetical protein|nr:hypothetical protein [Candidatus Aminicenantes bacterium AH-873-B07]
MKKLKTYIKKEHGLELLGIKFMGGNCLCDYDACASKCGGWDCLWHGYVNDAWESSHNVDRAILGVPPAE